VSIDTLPYCELPRLTCKNSISEIEVIQEGPVKIEPVHSFKNAGLHPAMLRNVELAGYDAPTPIQKFTIPAVNDGYDTIGIAQTGKNLEIITWVWNLLTIV
jgi:superfamily II DNA/RNA helicase